MTSPGRGVRAAGTPPPGTPWRRSAKVLVVDAAGSLLLLRMVDPVEPDRGEWWELPGGGLEPGESPEQAAARELAEETGVVVPVEAVGPALWTRRATFSWLGRRRWQEETVHVVRLPAGDPVTYAPLAPTEEETGSLLGVGWHRVDDLRSLRTYPGRLHELAPRVLAGESVDEGFEWWE